MEDRQGGNHLPPLIHFLPTQKNKLSPIQLLLPLQPLLHHSAQLISHPLTLRPALLYSILVLFLAQLPLSQPVDSLTIGADLMQFLLVEGEDPLLL